MTAPIASGWSGCRVGLAPTGKRRLSTAHTHLGHRPASHVAVAKRGPTSIRARSGRRLGARRHHAHAAVEAELAGFSVQ